MAQTGLRRGEAIGLRWIDVAVSSCNSTRTITCVLAVRSWPTQDDA
ncbi:MAG: hypothetical protein ABI808_06770 [Pseudonocardiales bacterium]